MFADKTMTEFVDGFEGEKQDPEGEYVVGGAAFEGVKRFSVFDDTRPVGTEKIKGDQEECDGSEDEGTGKDPAGIAIDDGEKAIGVPGLEADVEKAGMIDVRLTAFADALEDGKMVLLAGFLPERRFDSVEEVDDMRFGEGQRRITSGHLRCEIGRSARAIAQREDLEFERAEAEIGAFAGKFKDVAEFVVDSLLTDVQVAAQFGAAEALRADAGKLAAFGTKEHGNLSGRWGIRRKTRRRGQPCRAGGVRKKNP